MGKCQHVHNLFLTSDNETVIMQVVTPLLGCMGLQRSIKSTNIEVRDSRTGYLLPARDGPGTLPDGQSCWDAAAIAAAAVSRKMPKYEEMHTFSKMGMSEISRNVNLAEIIAPAGAS